MAGTDSRFDSERFVEAILFAQRMALPPDEADQPFFFPPDTREFTDVDDGGDPWDFRNPGDVTPDEAAPTGVLAVCGMVSKETKAMPRETAAGQLTPIRIRLSFVPSEWEKVSDFHTVRIGGIWYERDKTYPPSGLFNVAMTNIEVRARDAKGRDDG